MSNFLEIAEDLWRRNEVAEASDDFERVFKAIGYLQGIHSKARLDTYNIETVYSSFEMGKLLNSLPGTETVVQADELISSIKKVIAYTLERTTKLPIFADGVMPPKDYSDFAKIVKNLVQHKIDTSIITFNYDLGLDYSLYRYAIPATYCLDNKDSNLLSYMKLHGSLNWGKCKSCGEIVT